MDEYNPNASGRSRKRHEHGGIPEDLDDVARVRTSQPTAPGVQMQSINQRRRGPKSTNRIAVNDFEDVERPRVTSPNLRVKGLNLCRVLKESRPGESERWSVG